jgi:hypothetical protein
VKQEQHPSGYHAEPLSPADETWFRGEWAKLNAKPHRADDEHERDLMRSLVDDRRVQRALALMERRAALNLQFWARVHERARANRQLRHWATRSIRRPKRETNQ